MLVQGELLEERWLWCLLVLRKYSFLILPNQFEREWCHFFPSISRRCKVAIALLSPHTSLTFSLLLTRGLVRCLHQKCIRQLHDTWGFSAFFFVFSYPFSSISPFQIQLTDHWLPINSFCPATEKKIWFHEKIKKKKDGFITFQRQGETQETHKSIKVRSLGVGGTGSFSLRSY